MIIKKQLGRLLSVVLALIVLMSSLGLLTNAADDVYLTSDDRSATEVTIADDYDFSALGTNLAYDSTVSKFSGDGTGTMVYDETGGMKIANGSKGIFQTSDSRTEDESGVVKYTKTDTQMLKIAPNMEAKSYYLITYFIKCDTASGTNVRHYYNTTNWGGFNLTNNYSTDWQRVSYIYYTGNKTTNECAIGLYNSTTVYLDDFAVYKLTPAVGGESCKAGALLTADDAKYTASDDRSATEVTVADDYDFAALGTNLAYDSTVSKFNDDGTGTMVYDETNGMKRAYGSKGIFQTSDSRTEDESGVVKYTNTDTQMLKIAPNMEAKSYYLITYFIKCDTASGTNVRHYYNTTTWANFELTANYSTDWQRVTYIYYTGNKTTNECAIGLYNSTTVYLDDFAVYKLSSVVGGKSTEAGKLLSADDIKYTASDDRSVTELTVANNYDFTSFGTNLAYDSTVSKFSGDGTGVMVYDETGGMKRAYGSKGIFQTSDSRTEDESGVVKYTNTDTQMLKIAPNMEAKSYYLITYFIKCGTASGTNVRHYYNTTTWANFELTANYSTDWQRVTYIYYTGDKTTNECAIGLYNSTTVYLDDFAVYKLSSTIGGKSTEAGQLISPDDIKYTSSDERGVKNVTVSSKYDFTTLGTNLAYDSTVSKFSGDGTYDTANGIKVSYDENKVTFSADGANSQTQDSSGAVYLQKGQPALQIAPRLDAKSYYLVTFYAKNEASAANNVRHWYANWDYEELDGQSSEAWNRISYIVYTGKNTSLGTVGFYTSAEMWVDDFAVYKLGAAHGGKSYEAGSLISLSGEDEEDNDIIDNLPDERNLTIVTIDDDYDFTDEKLSENLAYDSTVSKFLNDGTYDTTNGISVRYAADKVVFSADEEGSYTQDGSGAVYLQKGMPALKIAPTMDAKSYYLVTYFVKNDGKSFNNVRHWYADWDAAEIEGGNESTSWKRISYIVYTGKNTSQATIALFTNTPMWLDDFAVYKLDNDYAAQCVAAGKLVQKDTAAIATPNVDGYNFEKDNNLVTDGSFEESGTQNSSAKFGSKVFNVTAENAKIALPRLSFTKYYLVTYYVRTNGFASSDKVLATFTNDEGAVRTVETGATNGEWKLVTAIINPGDHLDIEIVFDTAALASGKEIYIDGLAVHALPSAVNEAAGIIDAYKEGVLNSAITGSPKDVFGAEGERKEEHKIWDKLVSPVKSSDSETVTYASLFAKYYKDYQIQDKISRGFAPTGFGFRRQFSDVTCDPAYNLITNPACDDSTYWADSTNFATITTEESYEGGTSLKVSGEGLYVKKLQVKPNTSYYLTLRGMGYSDVIVPHIHFGIMDMNFLPFENPKTTYETSNSSRDGASKQEVTIMYPDGTWYRRTYQFNTGDNTEVYFFIKGVKGESYFDNIEIFEASKSKPRKQSESIENIDTTNDDETRFACDEKNNLIPNGMFDKGTEFWDKFNGMKETERSRQFVEVATSEGNKMLHFKGTKCSYYYLPKVKLEANKTYTFSFWYRTLNGEFTQFGIASLKNPRSYITTPREITNNRGEWTLCSITFNTFEESEVALCIYNYDGEAVFDKVRLFESKNGYELSLEEDMPKGGLTFSDSVLGTDGLVELDSEEQDEVIDDTVYEEDEFLEDYYDDDDDGENEETTTKVIKKYKKKPTAIKIATWFIILMIVIAVLVLAGITFLIIFLVKRKKKKAQTAQ